jgi:hypothetical protein
MSASLDDFNVVAAGGGHIVDGNLVTAAFEYPYGRTDAFRHYMWHSGMLLRHNMTSMKGNVVSGAENAGITFITQSTPNLAGTHAIQDNEGVACKYGAIPRNGGTTAAELYQFKAWSNQHAGIVAFDEVANLQLRDVTLADNYYGTVVSFVGHADLRVVQSTVIGQSAVSAHLGSQCHVKVGLTLPIYTPEPGPRCPTLFGGCKECSVDGRALGERFGNSATGRAESFYVESTRFSHFGLCNSRGIHYSETSPDYSPDLWLTRLQWHPETVNRTHRIRLGDTWGTHAGCASGSSCDAVNYMAAHDTDGSTLGDFWTNTVDSTLQNTTLYSDNNPAIGSEANCRTDPSTRSMVCVNFPLVTVSIDIPPQCNDGCLPVSHITIHRYAPTENRSFFSVGAFEQGCSCQKHFIGASFPAKLGLMYDVDMPIVSHPLAHRRD